MPPRKKTARGRGVASTPTPSVASSMVGGDDENGLSPPKKSPKKSSPEKAEHHPLNDVWTDEQETSLFKGLIKWKPVGMHKHFRMIALAEHLRNHGYNEIHTRIPGIWAKLHTLYNLELLDAAEDRLDFGALDEAEEDEEGIQRDSRGVWREFELPEEEFGELCFLRGRREASEAPSSPPQLDEPSEEPALPQPATVRKRKRGEQALGTRESTVEDTDAAGTSPAPPSSVRGSASGRGRGRGRGRGAASGIQRSSVDRGASRDTETGQETTEQDTATGEDDDETQEEEEDEDTAEEGSPNPRASGRGRGRGRGANLRGRGKRGKKRGGRGG